ncbi:aminoglycoside/choline kinase family phosphotransferase [Dysgonomonadaceae bacterium PH5-43]|nr:aminoglycoside/choline kinase family phosphotransferase [Dysgonomonadaceae bacterium PH5-43]
MQHLINNFERITNDLCREVETIKGSGSGRQYFRLKGNNTSMIGVVGEDVDENMAFVNMSYHFEKQNLPTPKVIYVSDDKKHYLQEDLGSVSLFDYIKNGRLTGSFSEQEIDMLKKTIRQLAVFQHKAAQGFDFKSCYPVEEFDKRNILWDLNYFKYCFLKPSNITFSENRLEDEFDTLANILLKGENNTFLYRDFQSRNIIIHNNKPYFIDYQGGRKGPVFYDVASFLWQAKANFPNNLRDELLLEYLSELNKYNNISESAFRQQLRHFVLFRTLQVLGAYGYRGLFEKKAHFIQSIPFAISNLQEILNDNYEYEYPYLIGLLRELCASYNKQKPTTLSPLMVTIYSFSYKKGIPEDKSGNGGGYVFDCRYIHNPGRYDEYKSLTGLDKPVIDFLEREGEIISFLDNIYALADKHIERYIERGFTSLMFSFGCTGGQHRSVYSAQHLADYIRDKYNVTVNLIHREQQ